MEKYNIQKTNSNLFKNKTFFFSRKFLSFSKSEEVANDFLQKAIFCEFKGVKVRFIVEATQDKDFFVSNIDINEMKLSAFSEEEEVLFLPLSCFEVVSIETEDFFGNEIKVIRLSYLNKYKKLINNNFEEILKDQKGLKLEEFINNAVNSKYSKGICKYLGHDFNENFYKEVSQKTNVELNYQPKIPIQFKNSNPVGKKFVLGKDFIKYLKQRENADVLLKNAELVVDNLNTGISSYQFGKYNGNDCLACYDANGKIIYFDDGFKCHVPSINDKFEICNNHDLCQKEFIPESEIYPAENMTVGRMGKLFNKALKKKATIKENGINKIEINKEIVLKQNKIKYKQSGAIEANIVGNALGHFLANFDQFMNADKENKKQMIIDTSIPLLSLAGRKIIGAIPVFKNTIANSIFRNGFIVISVIELCKS